MDASRSQGLLQQGRQRLTGRREQMGLVRHRHGESELRPRHSPCRRHNSHVVLRNTDYDFQFTAQVNVKPEKILTLKKKFRGD